MVKVDKSICKGCGACVNVCPAGAIQVVDGTAVVDGSKCVECGRCIGACPYGAISFPASESKSAFPGGYTPPLGGGAFGRGRGGGFGRGRGRGMGRGRGRGFFR